MKRLGATVAFRAQHAVEITNQENRLMDQMPNWLTAAVNAAGMTAYAEDIERMAVLKPKAKTSPTEENLLEEPQQPVH
jgi:hypothetical protein